jgi:hypothetical protein
LRRPAACRWLLMSTRKTARRGRLDERVPHLFGGADLCPLRFQASGARLRWCVCDV